MDGELIAKKSPLMFVAGLTLGLATGVAGGYKWASRKLGAEFDQRLEEETAKYKTFYTNVDNKKKYATPQDAVVDLIAKDPQAAAALTNYQGGEKVAYHNIENKEDEEEPLIDIPVVEVVEKNIFNVQVDPDKPYIISQEMFMEGEKDYSQTSLTWYEQDNIVSDERDDVLDDAELAIGEDFKVSFGTASSDENVVHVRNDKLGIDFEISKNASSFGEEVLGLDAPMQEPGLSARQRRAES